LTFVLLNKGNKGNTVPSARLKHDLWENINCPDISPLTFIIYYVSIHVSSVFWHIHLRCQVARTENQAKSAWQLTC